ncbi:MAG: hypothetical protein IJO19_02715, partial [Clostridia bacterium]|nr:hypothetical protein [Clostridia bacterium]
MKKCYKLLATVLCFSIMLTVSACSDYDNKESAKQVTYNTLFKQPSTPVPNTKITQKTQTEQAIDEVTETQIESITLPERTENRIFYEQVAEMRNISSEQLLQEINIGINIGDSFDYCGLGKDKEVEEYLTANGNPIVTESLIESYYKAGFKAVRIPVSWTDHIED